MAAVNLELFKKHVRADDFDDDDDYLGFLLESAESSVVRWTQRSLPELQAMGDGDLPLALQQAIMMLAGHWYNQREAVSGAQMTEVPYSLQALIKPYRKLTSDESRPDEDQA